jgi:hypothetical protein
MELVKDRPIIQLPQYYMATGWTIGCSSPSMGLEFFSSPPRPDRLWGPIQWVPQAPSLGVKRPPSNTEVKNAWSYTSAFPVRLHGVLLS